MLNSFLEHRWLDHLREVLSGKFGLPKPKPDFGSLQVPYATAFSAAVAAA